jgi:hypothetical protein
MRFGIGQKTDCTLEEGGKLFAVTRVRAPVEKSLSEAAG